VPPKPCQTNGGVGLRDPEDIADFPRRKTLQIQRREFSLDRLQAPHGIEKFTPPLVIWACQRWAAV